MSAYDIYELDCDLTHKKPSFLGFIYTETLIYLRKQFGGIDA